MIRTFRYFLRNAKINLGALLGFAAIVLAGAIVTGVPDGADNLFGTYFGTFPLISLLVLFLYSFALCTSCLNLALSFGARRRDYFWAVQANMVVYAAAATALQAIMSAIPHLLGWQNIDKWAILLSLGNWSGWVFPLLCLCLQILGSMCGLLQVRSKILGAIVMTAAMLVGIAATVLLLIAPLNSGHVWGQLPLALGAVTMTASVVGEVVMWKTIHNYVVR